MAAVGASTQGLQGVMEAMYLVRKLDKMQPLFMRTHQGILLRSDLKRQRNRHTK